MCIASAGVFVLALAYNISVLKCIGGINYKCSVCIASAGVFVLVLFAV